MYSTRYLGSEKYGILSFAIAFAFHTIFMADIGIASVIVRDVARDKERTQKYFGNSIFLKIILAIITLFSTAAIGYALGYPSSTMEIVLIINPFAHCSLLLWHRQFYSSLHMRLWNISHWAA